MSTSQAKAVASWELALRECSGSIAAVTAELALHHNSYQQHQQQQQQQKQQALTLQRCRATVPVY
eukprot:7621-Heterococcus_DN1.PRE.4